MDELKPTIRHPICNGAIFTINMLGKKTEITNPQIPYDGIINHDDKLDNKNATKNLLTATTSFPMRAITSDNLI